MFLSVLIHPNPKVSYLPNRLLILCCEPLTIPFRLLFLDYLHCIMPFCSDISHCRSRPKNVTILTSQITGLLLSSLPCLKYLSELFTVTFIHTSRVTNCCPNVIQVSIKNIPRHITLRNHKLYTAYDRGLSSRIVFMDISKGFDRVVHSGLIYKLEQLGIDQSLLNLLSSYLSGGSQIVRINDSSSNACYTNCGAPQGSVLGSLLSLIYVTVPSPPGGFGGLSPPNKAPSPPN